MSNITYNAIGIDVPDFNQEAVSRWIEAVARTHGKSVGALAYIFCNDAKIIEVNREFLHHDYYTDIITFDYSNSRRIAGDMFISLDTVRSNAEMLGKSYSEELMRVVIHGVLHLVGINDKGPGEREIMERHEDEALALLHDFDIYIS